MEIEQYAYLKLTSNEHLIYETDKILTTFEENHELTEWIFRQSLEVSVQYRQIWRDVYFACSLLCTSKTHFQLLEIKLKNFDWNSLFLCYSQATRQFVFSGCFWLWIAVLELHYRSSSGAHCMVNFNKYRGRKIKHACFESLMDKTFVPYWH